MNPDLQALRSRTNLSEEDLQVVLREKQLCLAQGDELGSAQCMLVLAHVVKWVRSDNEQAPFERSRSLAEEALPIFQRHNNTPGIVSALLMAAALAAPDQAKAMLDSAMELAQSSGDELLIAKVLSRQGARTGTVDRKQAVDMQRRSLEIYERRGDPNGQANCLFSLSVLEEERDVKYQAALQAAELFRSVGRFDQAARSLTLALMYHPKDLSLEDQRGHATQGLADAQASAVRSLEGSFYSHLSRIAAQQGNFDEAEQFRRWERDMEESDGLSPEKRLKDEVEFTKYMGGLAKQTGDNKAAKMFRDRLRELKKPNP